MGEEVRAPFPWFGGKSRVADVVWDRFGDVRNYVEPFAGSLAVLLARPSAPKIETVNDLDCWIANFWRALAADPEKLADIADWPVNEADLHARHLWLVNQIEFRERMKTDPDYFDVKIAAWWVWGISQWIGSGWCAERGGSGRQDPKGDPWRKRPNIANGGRSIHRNVSANIRPALNETSGILSRAEGVSRKRHYLTNHGGGMGIHWRGVLRVPQQIPNLSGDSGAAGRGVHASGVTQKIPAVGGRPWGMMSEPGMDTKGGLHQWLCDLAARLRRVRVCCGDWSRIVGPAPTTCIGLTGVFLDPPYAVAERADVYNEESRDVAHAVREWAILNGNDPLLRIALCGYEGEHAMPESWTAVAWKANGGFANQKKTVTQGKANAHRERIWFSPHCLDPQQGLFSRVDVDAGEPIEA